MSRAAFLHHHRFVFLPGQMDLGKMKPIIFDPAMNVYRVVGEVVGNAFKDGLKLK